ncbi:MAG TPA: hypothetical protein VM241_04345 [Candidatus Thermoplasmatota archaeon]|nr:hypothetical protein [Candidatus Thermoplasmatota archaeon]
MRPHPEPLLWVEDAEPPSLLPESALHEAAAPTVLLRPAVGRPPILVAEPAAPQGAEPASRSIQVRIGTVEVHAPAPERVAAAPEAAPAPFHGFEDYARLRTARGWEGP